MTNIITPAVVEAFTLIDIADEWPDDATLFEPCENEQALMYDYAECLSARTFLRMCDLPYRVEHRPNAEFISPNGHVPFLRIGDVIVSDFMPIVDLVAKKGVRLSEHLPLADQADMHAAMACIQEVLRYAQIWACWMHEPARYEIAFKRYGAVYPWPLSVVLPRMKLSEIRQHLTLVQWDNKTIEQVLSDVDHACRSLSVKLGDQNNYFCGGDTPTELDALAFGYLYTLMTTDMPDIDLAAVVRRYVNLTRFVQYIESTYFKKATPKKKISKS